MEECERDYVQRFLRDAHCEVAFFEAYNSQVFVHVGEAFSFRTAALRNRCDAGLKPYADILRNRCLPLFSIAKATYRVAMKLLVRIGLLR